MNSPRKDLWPATGPVMQSPRSPQRTPTPCLLRVISPFAEWWVAALLLAALLQGCTTGPQTGVTGRIFHGEAMFGKLPPAIRQSPLADVCPPPAIGRIHYVYRGFPNEETLGKADYVVADRTHGIAGLSMAATAHTPDNLFALPAWPSSSGRVLSCGGLFTLASREQRARDVIPLTPSVPGGTGHAVPETYNAKQPNRRYAVTQLSGYRGRLFPLRVGNELSFSCTALLQSPGSRKGRADKQSREHILYRVLGMNDAFVVNGMPVPGRVYLIEQVREREPDGVIEKRDYYYSEVLGWVIKQVSYDDGAPVSIMDVTEWN